jgi:superfamily II DNA/RNA helicase
VPLATTGENREVLNHLFADVSLGFAKLNLSPTIHHALVDMGFDKPTKLQMLLLSNIPPSGIEHHYTLQAGFGTVPYNSLFQHALTKSIGSGKSTGCLMVIMSEIERRLDHLNGKCHHKTGAIIIAPTRALVDQLVTDMRAIAKGSKATIGKFVGQTYNTVAADAERLKSCHVAICTPDRLARMGDVDQRYKKGIFENVDLLVIDEASEMEGKQWEDGIAYLKSLTARFQKTWLVILSTSNELDMEAKHSLKKRLVEDAEIMVKIKVPKDDATKAICSMMEFFVFDNVEEKDHWLQDVITVKHNSNSLEQTIVFVNSKRHTELMDTALFRAGIPCNFIHGGVNNE